MANPVLSRPEAFQRAGGPQAYGQPPYGQAPYQPTAYPQPDQQPYPPQGYGPAGSAQPAPGAPVPDQGRMTIDDVIAKSGITMGLLFVVAAATYLLMPVQLLSPVMLISAIVAFVTVLVVSRRRVIGPGAVLAYCAVEGLFVGAISKFFEFLYPGIVVQAVLGTFVAAGVTLAAYKHFRIRVTDKFRRIVTIATMGIAVTYLINLVISLFGVNTGLVGFGPSAGILSWVFSAVAVVAAVASLLMDFDYIEHGLANGAPASESWRAAFGLVVTMVWLYTELLRILSYFRD